MSTETVLRPCVGCHLAILEEDDSEVDAPLAGIYMLTACLAYGAETIRDELCPLHRAALEQSEAARQTVLREMKAEAS